MRKLITATALLVLIGGPAAIAQTGNSGGSSTAVKNQPPREAPVGHRQADRLVAEVDTGKRLAPFER